MLDCRGNIPIVSAAGTERGYWIYLNLQLYGTNSKIFQPNKFIQRKEELKIAKILRSSNFPTTEAFS